MRLYHVIFVTFFIVVSLALSSWAHGIIFKNYYLAYLQNLSTQGPVQIRVLDYQVGVFSSKVTLQVELNLSNKPNFAADQIVLHGPLVRDPVTHRYTFSYGLVQTTAKLPNLSPYLQPMSKQDIIEAETRVSYDGFFSSQIVFPDVSVNAANTAVAGVGIIGNVYITTQRGLISHAQAFFNINRLYSESNPSFTINKLSYQADMTRQANQVWNIYNVISSQDILIKDAEHREAIFQNIVAKVFVENNFSRITSKINAASLVVEAVDLAYFNSNNLSYSGDFAWHDKGGWGFANSLIIPVFSMNNLNSLAVTARNFQGDVYLRSNNNADLQIRSKFRVNALSMGSEALSYALHIENISTEHEYNILKIGTGNSRDIITIPAMNYSLGPNKEIKILGIDFLNMGRLSAENLFDELVQLTVNKIIFSNEVVGPLTTKFSLNALKVVPKNFSVNILQLLPKTQISNETTLRSVYGNLTAKWTWSPRLPMDVSLADIIKRSYLQLNIKAPIAMVKHYLDIIADKSEDPLDQSNINKLSFEEALNNVVKQNQLSSYLAMQLIDLQKRHLPFDQYVNQVDYMVMTDAISPDVANFVKLGYAKSEGIAISFPATLNKRQALQRQLDSWLAKGYIKREKDNYIVNLIYDRDVLKVNGIDPFEYAE